MKALACGLCGDIRAIRARQADDTWTICECGNAAARWIDPWRGTVEFDGRKATERSRCFILGLNNHLLEPALRGELGMFQDFREYHELATNAPGSVFDKSRASCWAVLVRAGQTGDVTWLEAASETPSRGRSGGPELPRKRGAT